MAYHWGGSYWFNRLEVESNYQFCSKKKINNTMGSNTTLGMRNNNPLNIRYSNLNNWKGQTGQNKGFCVFSDRKYGFRAAFINLRTYHRRGLNTIDKIISAWAPPTENHTQAYIKHVADSTGFDIYEPLTFDFGTYSAIVHAMCVVESVYRPNIAELKEAWDLI